MRYPEGHVVGVLDSVDRLAEATDALIAEGFRDSEIDVACGAAAADELKSTTGRGGLTDVLMRIGQSIGLENVEMEVKAHYEQALRDGKYVLRVATPTDERKDLAKHILAEHGASAVNYFGRYTIEVSVPPITG
jgi:hypothetical protein